MSTCSQTKMRSRTSSQSPASISVEIAFETGDQPSGHSLIPSAIRDACQQSERRDDQRDQAEDQVGLAEVASLEPRRPLHLADEERRGHADEDEDAEDVDEEEEPTLMAEPRQRPVAVDRPEQRHHDRREEDDEPPEDEGVHEAGHEPLEQLPLAEHDRRLRPDAAPHVAGAVGRLTRGGPTGRGRSRAGGTACRRRRRRGRARAPRLQCSCANALSRHDERAARMAAESAGTISCMSPITA